MRLAINTTPARIEETTWGCVGTHSRKKGFPVTFPAEASGHNAMHPEKGGEKGSPPLCHMALKHFDDLRGAPLPSKVKKRKRGQDIRANRQNKTSLGKG